jgi:serine/threonine-protein kinase PRP4
MPTDSRRKHRRSPSPDDHDKSSKRHKHRHRHRSSKKRDEEEIQFVAETVDSVKINHLPADDVEEGEILDDEPFEVKDDTDLRSHNKNPV